jgi:AcrR family transcriptional regulator
VAERTRARRSPVEGGRTALILEAAVALFVREGGAGFTARGVAKEAGVSLGSVQYLFPSKDRLLRAMLERVLAQYEAMYARVAAALPFNGEERLLGVVDFLVQDTWRPETRRFFFNFYALSCHDGFTATLLNQTYLHHRRRLAGYIGAARPALSERACFDLALQLSALIDGLMIFTGPGARSGGGGRSGGRRIGGRGGLAAMVKRTLRDWLDAAQDGPEAGVPAAGRPTRQPARRALPKCAVRG